MRFNVTGVCMNENNELTKTIAKFFDVRPEEVRLTLNIEVTERHNSVDIVGLVENANLNKLKEGRYA